VSVLLRVCKRLCIETRLLPSSKSTSATVASSSAIILDDAAAVTQDELDTEKKGYEGYFDRQGVTAAQERQQLRRCSMFIFTVTSSPSTVCTEGTAVVGGAAGTGGRGATLNFFGP
jgi:hypothetical protein